MSAFYFAFLAVLLAGIGARDQLAMAGLARGQGSRVATLLVGIAISAVTAAFAAWAASFVIPLLVPKARLVMAGIALGLSAAETLWPFGGRDPEEPTASLGALGIVLLAHQLTDAARFLVFALAVAMDAPIAAGIGGGAAGAASIAAAWLLPEHFTRSRLIWARRAVGVILLVAALIVGFQVRTA